ncbi:transposase [Pediococcus ethanolidurans]|nr:transposase [Pediococcus ethanolidurans]
MDVHKKTYSLCAFDAETGEIIAETKIIAEPKLVKKFIDNLATKYDDQTIFKTGYEAGCLGYSLYHDLTKLGIECTIMAPSTIAKTTKNKTNKNDATDARMLARSLAYRTYKAVYIPSDEDVAIREFIRMRKDFKLAFKKVKQQIKALILSQGLSYNGNANWSIPYVQWLRTVEFNQPVLREILDEYMQEYSHLDDKLERLKERIDEFADEERLELHKDLKCFKGVDTLSALTIQVEISDFNRFPNAASFAAYLGLTPMEHSSGEKINRGRISKQGNSVVRTTLIECAQALVKGAIGQKTKRIKARQKGRNSSVIDYADRGIERLQRKFHKMYKRGKPYNTAITAVARELACFVWGIETRHFEYRQV